MTKFILRFDDITPGMAWKKFLPLKTHLEDIGIKSILGVVPDCRDKHLSVEPEILNFFDKIRHFHEYGDAIAQHGTYHVYDTEESGLLALLSRSEFAGHQYQYQLSKLAVGKNILLKYGVWQPYFMPPSHSFDLNTITALIELKFIAITDGYGFYPYNINNITLVPQLSETPIKIGFGFQTISVHINTITKNRLVKLSKFIDKNYNNFIDFKLLPNQYISNNYFNKILRYFSKNALLYMRILKKSNKYFIL